MCLYSLRWLAALLLLAGRLVTAANAADAAGPQQVVQRFQDSLLAAMKTQGGYPARYRLLEPEVGRAFDFGDVARVALGRYWPKLTPAQRDSFVDVFSRLSAATYASQFDAYAGERFSPPTLEETRGDRAIVHSDLIESDDETVPFTYQLRQSQGRWRIVNVIANGVSDLAMKRAEYTDIIRNSGFDALLDRLRQKVARYGNGETG